MPALARGRGCPYCDAGTAGDGSDDAIGKSELSSAWLVHLYVCQKRSTYQIAGQTGISRQRVTMTLRKAGVEVRPRGAGRPRAARPGEPTGLPGLMRALYEEFRISSRQIATVLGMPERTVRTRLRSYGITTRTRGGWNREDRTTIPADVLGALYGEFGMTAEQVGEQLGVSRNVVLRSAHALGLPVRSGGAEPADGPVEIELLSALYADPLVDEVLTAYAVPRVRHGGSLSDRFPEPVPLTTPLVKDLYWGCGVSLNHVELLTGQASQSVRAFMQRAGIPLRHPGGRCSFLRRWRHGDGRPPQEDPARIRARRGMAQPSKGDAR